MVFANAIAGKPNRGSRCIYRKSAACGRRSGLLLVGYSSLIALGRIGAGHKKETAGKHYG
jgi:hypothetical protein